MNKRIESVIKRLKKLRAEAYKAILHLLEVSDDTKVKYYRASTDTEEVIYESFGEKELKEEIRIGEIEGYCAEEMCVPEFIKEELGTYLDIENEIYEIEKMKDAAALIEGARNVIRLIKDA